MRTLLLFGFVIAFNLHSTGSASAQGEYDVENPFVDPVARQNFKTCFPETSQGDLDGMARIAYLGYQGDDIEGCPPGTSCNPAVKFFRGRRTTIVKTSELNPGRMASLAAAQGKGGCDPTEISNFSSSIGLRFVRYSVHVYHEEKICTFLGDIKLGSGSADITWGADLRPDFTIVPFEQITNQDTDVNVFGIVLGSLGVSLLTGINFAIPALAATMFSHDLFKAPAGSSDFLGAGIHALGQFSTSPLDQIGSGDLYAMPYGTNQGESGFQNLGGDVSVKFIQEGHLPRATKDGYLQLRHFEIEFIKSLSAVGPERYTVQKGDNLWKLTVDRYGDGRLFWFVARYNGMEKPRKLAVGETLNLPRWQELCEKLKPKSLFVKKQESLWTKAIEGQIPFDVTRIKHIARSPDLIYPFEELEVLPEKPKPAVKKKAAKRSKHKLKKPSRVADGTSYTVGLRL